MLAFFVRLGMIGPIITVGGGIRQNFVEGLATGKGITFRFVSSKILVALGNLCCLFASQMRQVLVGHGFRFSCLYSYICF